MRNIGKEAQNEQKAPPKSLRTTQGQGSRVWSKAITPSDEQLVSVMQRLAVSQMEESLRKKRDHALQIRVSAVSHPIRLSANTTEGENPSKRL